MSDEWVADHNDSNLVNQEGQFRLRDIASSRMPQHVVSAGRYNHFQSPVSRDELHQSPSSTKVRFRAPADRQTSWIAESRGTNWDGQPTAQYAPGTGKSSRAEAVRTGGNTPDLFHESLVEPSNLDDNGHLFGSTPAVEGGQKTDTRVIDALRGQEAGNRGVGEPYADSMYAVGRHTNPHNMRFPLRQMNHGPVSGKDILRERDFNSTRQRNVGVDRRWEGSNGSGHDRAGVWSQAEKEIGRTMHRIVDVSSACPISFFSLFLPLCMSLTFCRVSCLTSGPRKLLYMIL